MSRSSFRLRAWIALVLLAGCGAAAWPLVAGAQGLQWLAALVFGALLLLGAWAGSSALAQPVERLAQRARALMRTSVGSGDEIE